MQEFLIVSAIASWIVIILSTLLNLVLMRHLNDVSHARKEQEGISPLPPGSIAPAFTAQTLDGLTVSNTDYVGKVSVFTFVSNLCGSCHELVQGLDEKIQSEISLSGLNFVLVGVNSMEDTQQFVVTTKTPIPSLSAPRTENSFSIDYKVWSTPITYVLDKDGRIKWVGTVSTQTIGHLLKDWVA